MLSALFTSISQVKAQSLSPAWSFQLSGDFTNVPKAIAADEMGNAYITGYYQGTMDFDPGSGVFNLIGTTDGGPEVYIAKYDPIGNLIWAKGVGGVSVDIGEAITTDPSGNVYVTGVFNDTVDFDPGIGVTALIASGDNSNTFILKLNSAGDFVWVKQFVGNASPNAISLDKKGNIYTTGYFFDTVDFDPGAGVANLTDTVAYWSHIFISKLDSDGNYKWARAMGGISGAAGSGVVVDSNENVFTIGYFRDVVDFDPGTGVSNLTSAGGDDIYILKLDSSGNYQWAEALGGSYEDISTNILLDTTGNIYTAGYFYGFTDLDPGPGFDTFRVNGGPYSEYLSNAFVLKLDPNGNHIWAKQFASPHDVHANYLALDVYNNVYTTGYFNDTTDFDPGSEVASFVPLDAPDNFITKLDSGGNYVWTKQLAGMQGNCIVADKSGNLYMTGAIGNDVYAEKLVCTDTTTSSITINSTDSVYVLNGETYTSNGTYIQRLPNAAHCDSIITLYLTLNNEDTKVNNIEAIADAISIFPNPTTDMCIVAAPVAVNITVSGIDGKIIMQIDNAKKIDIGTLTSGLYILRITDKNGMFLKNEKLIKVSQ